MSEDSERERMVREQLEQREVQDPRVLDAMRRVPRHLFVPEPLREFAYDDRPQPIGDEQTISQPLMVGLMSELLHLQGGEKMLEIGTGSGYQTAILAELAGEVVSVERLANLAERARNLLEWLGYGNVQIHVGDGSEGWPPGAPYQGILVAAASPQIPQPLLDQLAPHGRMVLPVGGPEMQTLTVVYKDAVGQVRADGYGPCVFVPLIGAHGWEAPPR